jgi:hypothetical protein
VLRSTLAATDLGSPWSSSHPASRSPQHGPLMPRLAAHRNALKNVKFTQTLVDVIKEAGVTGGCPKAKGNLLYTVASKVSGVRGSQLGVLPALATCQQQLMGWVACCCSTRPMP